MGIADFVTSVESRVRTEEVARANVTTALGIAETIFGDSWKLKKREFFDRYLYTEEVPLTSGQTVRVVGERGSHDHPELRSYDVTVMAAGRLENYCSFSRGSTSVRYSGNNEIDLTADAEILGILREVETKNPRIEKSNQHPRNKDHGIEEC